MKASLLLTTAVGLVISAGASAQSPTTPPSPPAQAPATTSPAPTSAQPASPSGSTTTAPAAQAPTSNTPASNQNSQTAPRSNDTADASNAAAPANNAATPAGTAQPSNEPMSSGKKSTAPSNAASQNVPSNTGGNSPATTPANTQQNANTPVSNTTNVNASDRDRDAVRKYSKTTTQLKTVGSGNSFQVRRGKRLPFSVEFEEFPETVYRDGPSLREIIISVETAALISLIQRTALFTKKLTNQSDGGDRTISSRSHYSGNLSLGSHYARLS